MLENHIVTLASLPAARKARLTGMHLPPAECQRLMEMGMTVGAEVTVLKRAPLGDPIEIAVRGGHLSIRANVAQSVSVEPLP